MSLKQHLQLAERLADASRAILREHWYVRGPGGQAFATKADASPVTEVDRSIEARLREMIGALQPDHGILGEEFPPVDTDAEYVWVLDPIDGTKQFITGIPVYGTLISLCRDGRPVLGIIDIPISGQRWIGASGQPTTLNGQPVSTRGCSRLADALMSCSNPEMIPDEHREGFERLLQGSKWRLYGAACHAYASLASGKLDLSVDSGGMREVDYCALVPVIEGAGGAISDWHGNPLTLNSGSTVVAAGDPRLHARIIDLLRQA
ncbi:inositol monophosphatase family protein [Pseudomonas sp. MOB-449]|nr:inositol monophosphatase family protein [Pseudomonas sp. MOB-449]